MRHAATVILILLLAAAARAQDASALQILPRRAELDVREMVDFANATTARLIGIGLVTGLQGTGDSHGLSGTTESLVAALRTQGVPINSPEQLERTRSAALVWVSVEVPNTGGRVGDRFPVTITTALDAESLEGGELQISPLRQHLPGDGVVAFAGGTIILDDPLILTRGRVRGGVELVDDIITHQVGETFELKVKTQYAGFAATELVASTLNEAYYNTDEPGLPPIAMAVDDRIVRVTVPEADRGAMAAFMRFILSRRIRDPELLNLPARVIVNRRTGAIVATADVDISPVGVSHEALQFTVTQPAPIATPQAPITTQERWANVASTASPSDMAKLTDLLAALRALDVPVRDQIDLLAMMHRTGALHAEFIEE
jgi:flagellar P-ring protein precursor FlgI